jgi:two-component system sensor histidine kinase BaeS
MREPGSRSRSTLALRLAAAFVAVAAVAMGIFAGLVLWASRGQVDELIERERQIALREATQEVADAYRRAGTWEAADLRPARALALSAGALITIRDASGRPVVDPEDLGLGDTEVAGDETSSRFGPETTARVVVAGEKVGSVSLQFPTHGSPPAIAELRHALTRTTLVAFGIGAGVALLVGLVVAHAITGPLRRLIVSVRRLGAGERDARADLTAPGELGELAAAVDLMAEQLEHEDVLRRNLAADVAHELRTPVTILGAQCEALIDGVVMPTPAQLESLREEVLRLGRAIEDVETLASAEAAGLHLEQAPTDLAEVARREANQLAPIFAEAEVELQTLLGGPVVVSGDAARLGQVVRNLLDNARKYTPAGGVVHLVVRAHGSDAQIIVRDTGCGIPLDELPHVFDRFWRGTTVAAAGSGIGLAVVRELVQAHGGSVEVTSRPGAGSTFMVEIPLVRPLRPDRTPASHASAGV